VEWKSTWNDGTTAKIPLLIFYTKLKICIFWLHPWQNERQPSMNNFWFCMSGHWKVTLSLLYIIIVLSALIGIRETYTLSSHLENWHWHKVNDVWSCIFGNRRGTWTQISINRMLAAIIDRSDRDIPATAFQTIRPHFIFKAASKYSWALQSIKLIKTSYIESWPHVTLINQVAISIVVEAPLTLISEIWQGRCCSHVGLYWLSIVWLCIIMTKSLFNYLT
jgi:hypothetical protein